MAGVNSFTILYLSGPQVSFENSYRISQRQKYLPMLTTATDAVGLCDVISCTELMPVVTWLADGTWAMVVGLRTTDSIGAYDLIGGCKDDTATKKYI